MNYDFSNLLTETSISSTDVYAMGGLFGAIAGAVAGFFAIFCIVAVVIPILTIIANWVIFNKAGEKGWKSIIPIYNVITLFKVAGISPWWVLGYLAVFIPFIGHLACLGITIYLYISLAKAFGKSTGFTVGLILLNTIFMMILAFGNSEYQLNKVVSEVPETEEK